MKKNKKGNHTSGKDKFSKEIEHLLSEFHTKKIALLNLRNQLKTEDNQKKDSLNK